MVNSLSLSVVYIHGLFTIHLAKQKLTVVPYPSLLIFSKVWKQKS